MLSFRNVKCVLEVMGWVKVADTQTGTLMDGVSDNIQEGQETQKGKNTR